MAGAKREAAGSPKATLAITLRLRPRASNLFEAVQLVIEGERPPYTRAEFTREFGMAPRDRALIEAWAKKEQVHITGLSEARRAVDLRASAGKLAQLFGVERVRYRKGETQFSSHLGSISLPRELAGVVIGVSGFDARPIASGRSSRSASARPPEGTPDPGFTPPEIAQHYRFPKGCTGKGQTVAVVALGGGYLKADMRSYYDQLHLPHPRFSDVSVHGAKNDPSPDQPGDGEDTADLQTLGALVPEAHIVAYFAPNTNRGFVGAVAHAIHDDRRRPAVISVSWGLNERHWSRRSLHEFNTILAEGALLGVTVCCASGDFGAFADSHDRQPGVNFPGCSPYALACGGTSLPRLRGGDSQEIAWKNSLGASGFGVSRLLDRPDWQKDRDLSLPRGKPPGRALPDVAAYADPAPGYRVFFRGKWYQGAGTSAAAPLWAGLVTLMNESHQTRLGLFTPFLYRHHKRLLRQGALRSIRSAGSKARSWDRHTGLGVPHGATLTAALRPRQAAIRRRIR